MFSFIFFKVHPSSLSIEGTLGNLRLRDMSLGTDHCWGWLCDIRNPGVESLIKVCYPVFVEQVMHCRMWVLFFYIYIHSNYSQNTISSIFFSSSNSILIVLKMMITKDMITACVGDFLLYALCSSIGLFRRYITKLLVIISVVSMFSSVNDSQGILIYCHSSFSWFLCDLKCL